jgi:hypothetical protein
MGAGSEVVILDNNRMYVGALRRDELLRGCLGGVPFAERHHGSPAVRQSDRSRRVRDSHQRAILSHEPVLLDAHRLPVETRQQHRALRRRKGGGLASANRPPSASIRPNPRGFGGRRRDGIDPSRIPPGQYYERGFPVLSAGPTPRTPLEEWTVLDQIAVDEARSWTWGEFAGQVWVTSALQSVPSVSVAPAVSGGVWDPRRCTPVSDRPARASTIAAITRLIQQDLLTTLRSRPDLDGVSCTDLAPVVTATSRLVSRFAA